jgi:hypothetical protein
MKPLKVNKYFFLIMSQKDLIQNQVLEEILRERTNYYVSKKKTTDFWTMISPTFIKELKINEKITATNFYLQHEREITGDTDNAFYASLVSLDKEFINWIQLRLGYFENLGNTIDSKLRREYVSDGIAGEFLLSDLKNTSPLDYDANFINPDLILERYKSVLDLYYRGDRSSSAKKQKVTIRRELTNEEIEEIKEQLEIKRRVGIFEKQLIFEKETKKKSVIIFN